MWNDDKKMHMKKALSATPALGGGFCFWQKELLVGKDADVTAYGDSALKEYVKRNPIVLKLPSGVLKSLNLQGLGDKGFGAMNLNTAMSLL